MRYKKTYRLIHEDKMSFICTINGVHRTLYFGGSNKALMVKGFYTTSDEDEQEFLEKSPLFNLTYKLERKERIDDGPVEEKAPVAGEKAEGEAPKFTKMTFKTVKDCQSYLQNEHGMKGYLYSSYAKCKEACKEVGVEATFENESY